MGADALRIFLAGDVMTGRGIDQILEHPSKPELHEGYIENAADYVALAERVHGPVPMIPVGAEYVWGDALAVLEHMQPELSLVNLETSITVSDEFWPDKAVHYRMHPANIDCLQVARIHVCTLANNHVLDFGRSGLIETLAALDAVGIAVAGAGRDLQAAARPARSPTQPGVAVFGFGVESSGIPRAWAAGPTRPGVRLLDDLSRATADRVVAHIQSNTGPAELAIAAIHWGSNWGHEIEPEHVAFAHRLVEGGVAVVHGHSSHHVRAIEVHRGKLILYGCGDLVTDYEGIEGYERWRGDLGAMFFATLSRRDGSLIDLCLVPMTMKKLRLTRVGPNDARALVDILNRISQPFGARFESTGAGLLLLRDGK